MPIARMLDGRVLEVPIEELEQFFADHGEEIELQEEELGEHDTPPNPLAFPFSERVELSR